MSYNDRYLNGLIPHLISKNISTTSTIKKRLKLQCLFSEVEEKASNHLLKFINQSTKRYQGMKSGTQIESVILNSKHSYNDFVEDILKDDLYTKCFSDGDKQFLKEKVVMQNVKNVKSVIKEVKTYSKELFKKKNMSVNNNSMITLLNLSHVKNWSNDSPLNPKMKHYFSDQTLIRSIDIDESKKREIIDEAIKDDYSKLNHQLQQYSDGIESYIKSKNCCWNNEGTTTSFFRKLSKSNEFSSDTIQLLSYRKPVQKKIEVIKRIDDVDIRYLQKMLKKYKRIRFKIASPQNQKNDSLVEVGNIFKKDYSNTIGLVHSVAKNSLLLHKSFNNKRQMLCEYLRNCDLPGIEDYNSKNALNIIDMEIIKMKQDTLDHYNTQIMQKDNDETNIHEKSEKTIEKKPNTHRLRVTPLFLTKYKLK